eukprot:4829654-Pyramimonas_sp.AAC.1
MASKTMRESCFSRCLCGGRRDQAHGAEWTRPRELLAREGPDQGGLDDPQVLGLLLVVEGNVGVLIAAEVLARDGEALAGGNRARPSGLGRSLAPRGRSCEGSLGWWSAEALEVVKVVDVGRVADCGGLAPLCQCLLAPYATDGGRGCL